MFSVVDREAVGRLVAGAQLAEVLPRDEYDDEHLPGALHVPLKQLPAAASVLDRARPVVVYCWDGLRDMSPRAAWRLERLGFSVVYDYAAGKVDWMAAGLPTVRADTTERRAIEAADPTPSTCAPEVSMATAAHLAADTGSRSVIVVNDGGIVLGRVREREFAKNAGVVVEDVMEPGPATVRAHEPLVPLVERMRSRRVSEIVVTTPEGHLLGVVRLEAT